MRKTILFAFSLLFLITACNKEKLEVDIPPQVPLFKVDLIKDGEPLLIEAGRNDFYLYTDNNLDASGVAFNPFSVFAKLDPCTSDCHESFSVHILNIPVEEVEIYFNEEDFNPEKFALGIDSNLPGAVEISYTSSEGVLYKSSLGDQDPTDFFNLTQIEPYLENENGQQTKLIHVGLQCRLFNSTGESIAFSQGELVVAVALP